MPARMLDDVMLSYAAVDRAAHLRQDAAFHAAQRAGGSARAVWASDGQLATADGALLLVPLSDIDASVELTFLGLDDTGRAYYLARGDVGSQPDWRSLREIGADLDDVLGSLAVMAVALDNWRNATRHCAGCGTPLAVAHGGWALRCPVEESMVFPRTDPAAIVLVIGADDRVALGRHVGWPEGRFSTFAGFVEAGESAEGAAAREVLEETGLRLDPSRLEYLGSQPWPFPQSLMLGYHARTESTEFALDEQEICEARWFSRDSLRAALAAGEVSLPPQLSISRRLIGRWLEAGD